MVYNIHFFFDMYCVVRLLASVGFLLFLSAALTPWYFEFIGGGVAQYSYEATSHHFLYIVSWSGCTESCDFKYDVEFWDFGENSDVHAIYGITWSLTVLATIFSMFVILTGKAVTGVCSIVLEIIALCIFFAVTPAYNADTMVCENGPCDQFAGYQEYDGLFDGSYVWGPSFGWIAAILAICWMGLVTLVGCCCCCVNCFCGKKKDNYEIQNSDYQQTTYPPEYSHNPSTPVFTPSPTYHSTNETYEEYSSPKKEFYQIPQYTPE